MKTLALAACPVCGSSAFHTFQFGEGVRLRRCLDCTAVSALEYADPTEVYTDGYLFGGAGKFGLDVRHPVFQRYLMRVADRRIRMIERATGMRAGALLDVGCGTGEVLLAARARGWRCQGVEPERTAAAMARERGLEVSVSALDHSGLPERSFDVVSAFHVLEHMPDSRAFLRTLARWARPGGFVVIEVPNWHSRQRRQARERWTGLRPGEHVVHFTPQTLRCALRSAGLEPLMVRTPAYVGPPQTLDHALADLARMGRFRRLLGPLSRAETRHGQPGRYPTRAGWAALRAAEAIHDRAGIGTVVFAVGTLRRGRARHQSSPDRATPESSSRGGG